MLDVAAFQRWVLGDLVDNANRGIFAEWLVGQALDAIEQGEARHGWAAFDLRYGEVTVEVKATGLSQTWNRHEQSKQPSFDIAPRRWTWDANTEEWMEFEPPERLAQLYVFCLHEPVQQRTATCASGLLEILGRPHRDVQWQAWPAEDGRGIYFESPD